MRIVTTGDDFAPVAADHVDQLIREVVTRAGEAHIALAGGSTPEPVYRALAERDLPWHKLHIYLGDERAVPSDDPESNLGRVRASLLDAVPIPHSRIHPMEAHAADPDEAARRYETLLPRRLDLILLGMGADAHVASLFPHGPALAVTDRDVVPVEGPSTPRRCLTLTPPPLGRARNVVILATGRAKAPAVARALQGDEAPADCPVRLVASRASWILDAAAASCLRGILP